MAKKIETGDPVAPKRMPRISVLERRLQNPFGEPSQSIQFRTPQGPIEGHWFNEATRPGQIHRAKELGWLPVTPEMITDMDSLGFHAISPTGTITRGMRSEEHLMWMPKDDYQRIQLAKTKKNLADMQDFDKDKHAMLNAMAKKLGGNAADYANQHIGPVGQVTDSLERVERLEPTE